MKTNKTTINISLSKEEIQIINHALMTYRNYYCKDDNVMSNEVKAIEIKLLNTNYYK